MKTLACLSLFLTFSALAQSAKFDANYKEVVIKNPNQTITLDAATANILLNAESITLLDGTIINIKKPTNFNSDSIKDINSINGSNLIIKMEGGSGTGGGG